MGNQFPADRELINSYLDDGYTVSWGSSKKTSSSVVVTLSRDGCVGEDVDRHLFDAEVSLDLYEQMENELLHGNASRLT